MDSNTSWPPIYGGSDELRRAWLDHRSQQQFEHQLIDRKTTWLLSTQAILFAAYGLSFQNATSSLGDVEHFRHVVSYTGIALSVLTLVGVLAVIRSKLLDWKDFDQHATKQSASVSPKGISQWGVRTGNTILSLFPDALFPVVMLVAWVLLATR